MSEDRRIITRNEWGAQHSDGAGPAPLPANGLRVHHSVTIAPDLLPPFTDDYAAVRTLERIGQQRFKRGISYTFAITPVGLIFQGHSVDRLGSHTKGRNSIERAIVFVGNYEVDFLTDEQIDSAGWLAAHGFLMGWWKAAPTLGGHRDVGVTACPGTNAYEAIHLIDAKAKQYVDELINPQKENGFMSALNHEEQKELLKKTREIHREIATSIPPDEARGQKASARWLIGNGYNRLERVLDRLKEVLDFLKKKK